MGKFDPQTDGELNVALAEEKGLHVYPQAVTLIPGVTRRIQVSIEGQPTAPELLIASITGTKYLVSNPNVLEVTSEGVITAKASGIANVTVINGGAETIIPVLVELPHASGSSLGTNGGAVRAVDGAMVTIAPGALANDTPVSIQQLRQNQLTVPLNDQFNFVGAFQLDVGTQDLNTPVQLALPAPVGAVVGQEVFFMRQDTIPNAQGVLQPIWIIVESGRVGTDGMVRTTSEPWPGAYRSGTYTVAVPNFAYQVAFTKAVLEDYKALYGALMLSVVPGALIVAGGILVATETLITNNSLIPSFNGKSAYLPILTPIGQTGIETIIVPRIGLPYKTSGNVQINAGQIPIATVKIPAPPVEVIDPQIQGISIKFEETLQPQKVEPLIYITGQNFGTDINSLKVKFKGAMSDKDYQLHIRANLSNLTKGILVVDPTDREFVGINSSLQVERTVATNNGNLPAVLISKTVPIKVEVPWDNLALVPQSFGHSVSVFRTDDYAKTINQYKDNSNLLVATIPVGQIGDHSDGPRYVAVTGDRQRAYSTLEGSGQIAVIDLLTMRQVDASHEPGASLPDFNPTINLPPGASPFTIAIGSQDKYAYIADRNQGMIYVLDIDPSSASFHQVKRNIAIDNVSGGLGQMSIDPSGKYLFVVNPRSLQAGKGELVVIDLNTNKKVYAFSIDGFPTGIKFAPKTAANITQVLFTQRQDDARGVGVLTITDNKFAEGKIKYIPLGLGSPFDYFDVNEGVSITVSNDGKYGFVAGRNSRYMGSGINSVDADYRAGSNIGIIADPLTANARLIAATRPIFGAAFNGVALSGDGKVLFGVEQISGSVFAFDVEQIVKTIEHPEKFAIDQKGRGTGYPNLADNPTLFDADTSPFFPLPLPFGLPTSSTAIEPTPVKITDLSKYPIDDINPLVDWIAGDLRHLQPNTGLAVPKNSPAPPLGIGNNPYSVTTTSNLIKLAPVSSPLNPAFSWDFEVPDANISQVNLFVSTFDVGAGLLPWDKPVDVSNPQLLPDLSEADKLKLLTQKTLGFDDFNPGRILTATWSNNQWKLSDETIITSGDKHHFTLPQDRRLTAGQTYHWAVRAVMLDGQSQTRIGEFDTRGAIASTSPFSSVTVLTHGFSLDPTRTGVPDEFYRMGNSLIHDSGTKVDEVGLMLRYDKLTGNWIPVDENQVTLSQVTGGLSVSDDKYSATLAANIKAHYLHKALVLLPEWSTNGESTIPDTGFTEAAADALFAAMVKLDQSLGGEVGEHDASGKLTRLYDEKGGLIRKQGALLDSPLHFIGFSRGTVVNSEIIQRLGTDFVHAGGVYRDASGKVIKGDLQMTTIDLHDFKQDNLNKGWLSFANPIIGGKAKDYSNFSEPEVKVWDNVTFADNYYQERTNTDAFGGAGSVTPNGRFLDGADINKNLTELTGFKHDNGLGANHGRVLTWYAGTLDLGLDEFPQKPLAFVPYGYKEEGQPVYDELGDSALVGMNVKAGELSGAWYQANHSNEGVGEGFYFAHLGGGADLRVHSAVARTSVFTDNSNLTQQKGDNAVPDVFNGTFDSALNKDSSNSGIPGWSFNNGKDLSGSQPISGGFKLVNQKNIVNLKKLIQDNSVLADWAACQNINNSKLNDYNTLRLNMETGNVAIHNKTYLSAIAQTLSFDLFTPNLSESTAGDTLKVYMSEDGLNFNEINSPNPTRYSSPLIVDYNLAQWGDLNHRPAVELQLPDISLTTGYDIQYQLNRPDYARRGFETFYLDIPDRFRGKTVYIKFELSSTHSQTIYLDNVGVANSNTKLGLPRLNGQLAINSEEFQTQFKDNYLIIKPQYTLSYNDATKIPNWVSFQLNCAWIEQEKNVNIDRKNATPFSIDTDVPWNPVRDDYYQSSLIPTRGHLAGSDERKRTQKDLSATFVTSNIVPSFEPKPWQDFEKYLRGKVMDNKGNPLMDGKDVYIITGGYGNSSSLYPNDPLVENGVTVPDHLWKIAVVLKSTGYRLQDINQNAISEVVAIDVPNRPDGDSLFGGKTTYSDWLTKINTLENKTGLTFLANLPELLQTQLKNTKHWLSATLLAENLDSSFTSPIWANNQITIGKDGIPQQSTSEKVIPVQLEIGTGLSTFKVSPFQDGMITSGIKQAGITQNSIVQPSTPQVGIVQTSPSQISTAQDRRAQIAARQIGSFEVTPTQIGSSEIGTTQIDSLKIAGAEVTPGQFSSFQVGAGKIKLSQDRFGEIGTTQITGDRSTNINMNSFDLSHSQIGILQINTSDQTTEISSSHDTLVNLKSINIGRSKIDFTQVTPFKSTVPELSELEVSTSEIGINKFAAQFNLTQIQSSKVSYPSLITSSQLFASDLSHDASPNLLTNIYNTAQSIWHTTTPIDLNFAITNLPTGQLAEGTITSYNPNGTPKTATITIDDDANGVGWFLDTTPQDNSEFTGADNYLQATPNSQASGKYDLLTAILHEMGHTLGIINGYSEFDKYVKNGIFTTDTFTTKLTPDGSHLDSTLYPYDLMNTSLKPGVRKLPSAMDWAIINAINSGVGGGVSGVGTVNPAHLTAGALIGITNGDFTTATTWNTLGATNIINGTATLTEQSQKLSELTQAFIIPTGAKTLQFTITDNHLIPGDTTKTANDAFEVALLDTNTYNPLAGTSIGLNHTDSLLNIQANGTIHKSDKVTITALGNNSTIVTIDLTQVTPTTQATLYFNLLGFGAKTSTVTIDDVKLFTDTQPIPITKNDTLNTNQATPITFNPTTNDTNVTQIQIINQPQHGTLTQTTDGKLTYQPVPTYVGNDSFTYLGYGSDGQISNLATVNLTVNNLPPTIQTVTIPTTINEGQTIQLSALAKDGGSSENLTYTWNLGDGSNPITGSNIAHTYTDNGNYEVTLTVTDKDGGSTNQTTTVKVDNLAPTVNLTAPTTSLNQGESLNLGVTYSDPGIKDTHTITWNFNDGTTPITGVTNPNHTFLKAGTNNVTVTVTDNDGASTTKSLQIAVANLPPTINTLDIPTNINEGSTVQLTVTATDPGNDTLIYNWYINGATTPIVGQTIDYQFTDNGVYPVRLNVIDSNGAIATKSVDVTINNVAPVIISIVQPKQINEGQPGQKRSPKTRFGSKLLSLFTLDSFALILA